ncbi:MAG TPA: hypothetical protein VI932_11535 [Bacteroidota bacterium]|nr:hypothetical protein [Bacteroidota bacterium]
MAGLAALTRTLHDSSAGTGREGIERFSSGSREYAAYEVVTEGKRMRVVVFSAGGYYYECEAWPVRPPAGAGLYDRLFSAQQTVLRSLR